MRNRIAWSNSLFAKLIIGLVFVTFCAAGFAQIQVRNAEDLNNVRNGMNENYIQVADIDLRGINWTPIGTSRGPFTGTYDGGGFVIRNLTIERDGGDTGLFGGLNGTIRNVGIENANVTGGRNTAILLAYLVNGTVEQCYVSGEVTGTSYVGGLIGFIGRGDNMNVINSYAVGAATSENQVGGLAGDAHAGSIVNCYASVYLNGNPDFAGGLIGRETGRAEVRGSFWDREVSTVAESAGGTGLPTESMIQERTFSREWDFRETWAIADGESYPYLQWQGREPGDHNYPPAEGSPSNLVGVSGNGQVSLTWDEPPAGEWTAYNVYRDGERIGQTGEDETEYVDRNAENYTTYSYYVTAVWEDETESRPSNTVLVTPHLPFAGGDGSVEAPFQVATAQNLNDVRFNLNSHFLQTENINIGTPPWNQGEGWEPIGYFVNTQDNRAFRGSYDGGGHVITGMTIIAPDGNELGFFGYINNALLKDIALEDVAIIARNNIGPLVVRIDGESVLRGCRVSGEIEANEEVGGLVHRGSGVQMIDCHFDGVLTGRTRTAGLISTGINANTRIIRCTVSGTLTGNWQFAAGVTATIPAGAVVDSTIVSLEMTGVTDCGGFTGWNSGTISNSAFLGRITGNLSVGGIAGQNRGTGTIINCFVDGHIRGNRVIGGIVGNSGGATMDPNVSVRNCYVRGTVESIDEAGGINIGGIAGSSRGTIANCYSTARVLGPIGQTSGILHNRLAGAVTASYWDTEASEVNNSNGGGEGRVTRQMIHPYDATTYIGWDFDDIWQHDPNQLGNDGYPMLFWQEVPEMIEPPVLDITIVTEDEVDYSVLTWERVEGALSYKVYATDDISTANWGEPIATVGETRFQEEASTSHRFYRVVASIEAPPEE